MSSTNEPRSSRTSRPPLAESPFFWLLLFVLVGSLGVVAINPKYNIRQSRIERRFDARQDAAARQSRGEQAPLAQDVDSDPAFQTQPRTSQATLLLIFATLAVVAAVGLIVFRIRSIAHAPTTTSEPTPTNPHNPASHSRSPTA